MSLNKLYIIFILYFLIITFRLFIADLIKELELFLTVVLVLLKINFGHTQMSVPKIGIQMSKTACINPWYHWMTLQNMVRENILQLLNQ